MATAKSHQFFNFYYKSNSGVGVENPRGWMRASPKLKVNVRNFGVFYAEACQAGGVETEGAWFDFLVRFWKEEILRDHTKGDPNWNGVKVRKFCEECVVWSPTTPDEPINLSVVKTVRGKKEDPPTYINADPKKHGFDPASLPDDVIIAILDDRCRRYVKGDLLKANEDLPLLKGYERSRGRKGPSASIVKQDTLDENAMIALIMSGKG